MKTTSKAAPKGLVEQFTEYIVAVKGYSEHTALAYGSDLRIFVGWMRTWRGDARWSNIGQRDLERFITECYEMGKTPATTNRYLATINTFYRWLKHTGHECDNPARYEYRRKLVKRVPRTIPNEDIQAAYSHATGNTRYMLDILATTGIRIGELLNICIEDIDATAGTIRIKGKGAKERVVYCMTNTLCEIMKDHWGTPKGTPIFGYEPRVARTMIYNALRPYTDAPQLSPHAIRHSFATEMARNGANVATIANILGHESIQTTQKYIDMTKMERDGRQYADTLLRKTA